MSRKQLHARPLRPADKRAVQMQEHEGMLTQWTATTVRLAAMDIVVSVIYLAPNIGIQGTNWTTLLELSDYLHVQGLPFIVGGDFNAEIGEMEVTCMDRFLGAEWLAPRGAVPGGHRSIDLVLTSSCLRNVLDIQWDDTSPRATPHTGFRISLRREALSLQVRVL